MNYSMFFWELVIKKSICCPHLCALSFSRGTICLRASSFTLPVLSVLIHVFSSPSMCLSEAGLLPVLLLPKGVSWHSGKISDCPQQQGRDQSSTRLSYPAACFPHKHQLPGETCDIIGRDVCVGKGARGRGGGGGPSHTTSCLNQSPKIQTINSTSRQQTSTSLAFSVTLTFPRTQNVLFFPVSALPGKKQNKTKQAASQLL